MRVTHDHLSVEETDNGRYKVVAWSLDGHPCTIDDGLEYEDAEGLRIALAATIETWA